MAAVPFRLRQRVRGGFALVQRRRVHEEDAADGEPRLGREFERRQRADAASADVEARDAMRRKRSGDGLHHGRRVARKRALQRRRDPAARPMNHDDLALRREPAGERIPVVRTAGKVRQQDQRIPLCRRGFEAMGEQARRQGPEHAARQSIRRETRLGRNRSRGRARRSTRHGRPAPRGPGRGARCPSSAAAAAGGPDGRRAGHPSGTSA